MTASFIVLACLAALNPKLLVVDLLLIGNRRPVPMFVCFMLGGIGLAVAIGLVDVFVIQADAIKAQASLSAGLDLALGIPLVVVGALLASGRLHRRQRQPHARPAAKPPPRIQAWARRVLHEPRFGLAVITERRSARSAANISWHCTRWSLEKHPPPSRPPTLLSLSSLSSRW